MEISFIKHYRTSPLNVAKFILALLPVLILLYICNQNVAFTGVHKIRITSFLHLPKSVTYAGGSEIGLVSTPQGLRTRPYKDQTQFAVTLPRGFNTVTMRAEVSADPYATIALGAKVPITSASQSTTFRLPSAFDSMWRKIPLENGNLYVKNHPEIQNIRDFWNNFSKLENIYSVGKGLVDSMPVEMYQTPPNIHLVKLPGGYRSSFEVNAFFDGKPQQILFDTNVVNSTPGDKSMRVTLEYNGKIISEKYITDNSKNILHNNLNFPAGFSGFYTLRFSANSEATVVSNVQFFGDAVKLSNKLFFDQSKSAVRVYANCKDLQVNAVHKLGTENPITINTKLIKLIEVKQPQKVSLQSGMNTLVFPRADVSISNSCGFLLEPELGIRTNLENFAERIIEVHTLNATTMQSADFIYDSLLTAQLVHNKNETYVLERTFDLHALAATGKTFTFSITQPGLTTQPGAFLHIKNISFTAKRPVSSFGDIRKGVRSIFIK